MKKFTYDLYHHIKQPTFILSSVAHQHYGVINNIDPDSVSFSFNMNSAQEGSFEVHKYIDGVLCPLWDKIRSFRYVFIPEHGEHGEYYNLEVTVVEGNNTVKQCTLTSASEFELSNKNIMSLEINTDSDFDWQEYVDDQGQKVKEYSLSTLYKRNTLDEPANEAFSILHRVLKDKCPDWSIAHCDASIANEWGEFSINGQSVYDVLVNTLAKEFDCLFQFDSVNRTISVYDLLNKCNYCGGRGDFTSVCPECGHTDISRGYGNDSNIFISYNNYSEKMTVDGDEGNVKNCFYVTGGDDYFNDMVRSCNPTRSNYIYNFSAMDYEDMPPSKCRDCNTVGHFTDTCPNCGGHNIDIGLGEALQKYSDLVEETRPVYETALGNYHHALNEYYWYKTSMMPRTGLTRWEANHYYEMTSNEFIYVKTLPSWAYLECLSLPGGYSGSEEFDATTVYDGQIIQDGTVTWKVRRIKFQEGKASEQEAVISNYFTSNQIYFLGNSLPSMILVNNSVKNLAKIAVGSLFKVDIITGDSSYPEPHVLNNIWYGCIKITNVNDSSDVWVINDTVHPTIVMVNGKTDADYPKYLKYWNQQVSSRMAKDENTYTSIFDIDDLVLFTEELEKYSLDRLTSFNDTYSAGLEVLSSQGINDPDKMYLDTYDLYTPIYLPMHQKLQAIQAELALRDATVKYYYNDTTIQNSVGDEGQVQKYLKQLDSIAQQLNMEQYLNNINPTYWGLFHAYIRESTYNNSNYISGDRSDGAILDDAKKLLKIANIDLRKASEIQYTLSDSIMNLLNTEEFAPFKDKFEIGDYLFCEADDKIYKLRLIKVSYDYGSPASLNVTFSNVTRIENYFSDVKSVLDQAHSIGQTYQTTMHQVDKNAKTTGTVDEWLSDGLNTALAKIKNNNMEEVTVDNQGVISRQYNDITETYDDRQVRMTHNALEFTENNWLTASLAIGEFPYEKFVNGVKQEDVGYGVIGKFVKAGYVIGSQVIAGQIYSNNYTDTIVGGEHVYTGSHIDLENGKFVLANGKIQWNNSALDIAGNITTESGDIGGWKITSSTLTKTTDTTHFITLDSQNKSIYMRDGDYKVAVTSGGISLYYNEQIASQYRGGLYGASATGTNKRGSAISIEEGNSYFMLGYKSGEYVYSRLLINNGLNPDGNTQNLIVDGTTLFKYKTTFNADIDMNGKTTFNADINMNSNSIDWVCANTDWAFIDAGAYGGTADQGYLELSTGDNGNEPIQVTQCTGTRSNPTRVRTAYLLNSSGDTSFPGTLYVSGNNFAGDTSLTTSGGNAVERRIGSRVSGHNSYMFIEYGGRTGFYRNDYSTEYKRIIQLATNGNIQIGDVGSYVDTAGHWHDASSIKIKKNVEDITDKEAIKLLDLRPVKFDFKWSETDKQLQRGLIAEEVEKLFPELVAEQYKDEGDPEFQPKAIDYTGFIPYLIKIIQIQKEDIETLKTRINKLEGGE